MKVGMTELAPQKQHWLMSSSSSPGDNTSHKGVLTDAPLVRCGFGFSEILFPRDNANLKVQPSFFCLPEKTALLGNARYNTGGSSLHKGHQTGRSQQATTCFLTCQPGGISSASFWELVPWQTGSNSHKQKRTCLNVSKRPMCECLREHRWFSLSLPFISYIKKWTLWWHFHKCIECLYMFIPLLLSHILPPVPFHNCLHFTPVSHLPPKFHKWEKISHACLWLRLISLSSVTSSHSDTNNMISFFFTDEEHSTT